MTVWLVRAGRHGEREDLALQSGTALIGWSELSDLSKVDTREQVRDLLTRAYPDSKPNTITTWTGQLWAFLRRIQTNDLVILPLKKRSAIAIGRVTGPYQYRSDFPSDARHTRPVEWLRTDLPRSAFDQDLLYSLGAFMTVCRIERNNAEARIEAILKGKPSPRVAEELTAEATDEAAPPIDLEAYSRDLIREHIGRKFKGHDLERLIADVLRAMGYQAQLPPQGADAGVDIVAGRGSMGFDPPRLCVQVKSGTDPIDVKVLHELQGVMNNFGAEQGLLVSWGGFKTSVINEARKLFFNVRLWTADDLVDAILDNYDRLPDILQAELPLKRIWTLVQEED